MRRLAQFGALLSLGACSPKGTGAGGPSDGMSSSATTSGASTESDGGSGGTGEVECVSLSMTECDINEAPCSPADFNVPECGGEELFSGSDHQCVARALRDNTPGAVFIYTGTPGSMVAESCGYNDFLLILGDGTAVVVRSAGGSPFLIQSHRVEIRPPEFFEPCVDSDDPATVAACLTDWFVPDSCVPELCCPGPNEAGHPLCD